MSLRKKMSIKNNFKIYWIFVSVCIGVALSQRTTTTTRRPTTTTTTTQKTASTTAKTATTTSVPSGGTTAAPSTQSETNCVFPFQYNGVWYNKCTSSDGGSTYWCSLDKVFNQRKATCQQECPSLARKLTPNHSSCIKPSSSAQSLYPNATQLPGILSAHNNIRGNLSPTAADMPQVTWDIGLAMTAQSWAENCVFDHDCYDCRALLNNQSIIVGQNAYASFGAKYDPQTFWQNVVQSWASESKNFKYGTGSTTGNFADIGHYTQIIYSGTVKIGCGAANCGSNTIYAFCNYAVGQGDTQKPYKSGTTCASCASKCSNNLCQCDLICQNSGTINLDKCACTCPSGYTGTVCETKASSG